LCDIFRDNAEDCAFLAERAEDGEVKRALKRMEEAWRTLAQEQDQLDNKRWSTKKPPREAADFYRSTRPLTAGFHVARRNNECPLRARSRRSLTLAEIAHALVKPT
jgi:hypothetical protein